MSIDDECWEGDKAKWLVLRAWSGTVGEVVLRAGSGTVGENDSYFYEMLVQNGPNHYECADRTI